MKLKKLETTETDTLAPLSDGEMGTFAPVAAAPAAGSKVATTIAFVASLVAAILIGAAAAMMYVNWELIANV